MLLVENEEMKKQLAEMNRKLEAVKDYVPPPKEEEKPKGTTKRRAAKNAASYLFEANIYPIYMEYC